MSLQKTIPSIIQQKFTKVSGEIGIKKYKICELIGVGAHSKCYKCINLSTMNEFAVKIITKTDQKKKSYQEKIISEVNIHKTLYHQNIVKFYSAFEDKNFIYFIVELCQKQTLLEYLKNQKKLTSQEVKRIVTQIINAVDYMHQNQIIHRDLKLANIFLDHNMQIKIGDFGEATKLEFADEKKVSVCGTLNYLAPEIVSGPFGHSYEVDFWAIGVISFALLFGKSPFHSKDENETLQRIKQCKFEFPSIAVPAEAKDFIRKILVCDPKLRMNLKQMLEHPFLSAKQLSSVKSQTFLNKIFTNQLFRPSVQQSPSTLLQKSKSCQTLQNNFALRQALSLKGEKKTTQSYSKIIKNFQPLMVDCFLDYSKKYGFGYILNKNTYGIIFNDGSVISSDQGKRKIYFVNNPKTNPNSINEYHSENLPKDRDFQKKYLLLDRFINLLKMQYLKKKRSQNESQFNSNVFVYVKQWWKNSQATMMKLSNDHFQVIFQDGSITVLDLLQNSIFIKSKEGNKSFFSKIQEAISSQESQFRKKSVYTKEIYLSIQRRMIG